MKKATAITCVFLDIGGVLLTDGWDRHARKRGTPSLKLELAEMEDRHHLTFYTYEEGKLTLEEYLSRVVFYQKRPFTRAQLRRFIFAQSKPVKHRTCGRLKRSRCFATRSRNGSAHSQRRWADWTRRYSLVASERTRPRSAPEFAMG